MIMLVLFMSAVAHAVDPTSIPPSSVPDLDSAKHVLDGDWLSTMVVEYYGPGMIFLTPYVCQYNKQRGRVPENVSGCNHIDRGWEVLLPPKNVILCLMAKDLGQTCDAPAGVDVSPLVVGMPPQIHACVETMYKNNPDSSLAQLAMLAKGLSTILPPDDPKYAKACSKVTPETITHAGFKEAPPDYFTIGPDGKPIMTYNWN